MSRQEVADAVNAYLYAQGRSNEAPIDASYIGKLERGCHRWPRDTRREAFRAVLRAGSDAELGFYIVRQSRAAGDPPREALELTGITDQRPEFLRTAPVRTTPASATPPDGDRAPVLDSPEEIFGRMRRLGEAGIGEAELDYLDSTVAEAIQTFERTDPRRLATHLRSLLAEVDRSLHARHHPRHLARLYAAAARMSGLLGSLAVDLGDIPAARAYAASAYQLGVHLADASTTAWARATQSLVEYYAGRYTHSLDLARHGQRLDPTGPHLARLLVQGEARALAKRGDARAVADAVARAFDLAPDQPAADGMCPSLSLERYCRTRVAANAATAYLAVGQNTKAHRYATQVLPIIDLTGFDGAQALTRIDLATSLLADDVDEAAAVVEQALGFSGRMSVYQRAQQFRAAAVPWGDRPSLRAVADHLHARQPPSAPADRPRGGGRDDLP